MPCEQRYRGLTSLRQMALSPDGTEKTKSILKLIDSSLTTVGVTLIKMVWEAQPDKSVMLNEQGMEPL